MEEYLSEQEGEQPTKKIEFNRNSQDFKRLLSRKGRNINSQGDSTQFNNNLQNSLIKSRKNSNSYLY